MASKVFDRNGNANIAELLKALRPTDIEAQTFVNESARLHFARKSA